LLLLQKILRARIMDIPRQSSIFNLENHFTTEITEKKILF